MPSGINHITIAISDLDVSLRFYQQIIGCTPKVKWNKGAYLTLGDLWLCLSVDQPSPSNDYSHIAFSISQQELKNFNDLVLSNKLKTWKTNASEGESIYLLDPDDNKLELHCGDLTTRLKSLKEKPYTGLEWF